MRNRALRDQRTGALLLVVLGCLALVTVLVLSWAKTALLELGRARAAEDRLQAEWLADSAIRRAAGQLVANSEYQGETWRVTAGDFGRVAEPDADAKAGDANLVIGEATIAVERISDRPGFRLVKVRADFPIAAERQSQAGRVTNRIRRQATFDLTEPPPKNIRKQINLDEEKPEEPQ
ncbi:MAG TPA: hypothetical protein VMF30_18115 [Pirellulales bacterium]|nr:hypothetical protein [Pirellulales bacterium]